MEAVTLMNNVRMAAQQSGWGVGRVGEMMRITASSPILDKFIIEVRTISSRELVGSVRPGVNLKDYSDSRAKSILRFAMQRNGSTKHVGVWGYDPDTNELEYKRPIGLPGELADLTSIVTEVELFLEILAAAGVVAQAAADEEFDKALHT